MRLVCQPFGVEKGQSMVKNWHIIVVVSLLLIGGGWRARGTFAEKIYAEETRRQVVEMKDTDMLEYLDKQRLWYRRNCTKPAVDNLWKCSQDDLDDYNKILRKIELLEDKLGIDNG